MKEKRVQNNYTIPRRNAKKNRYDTTCQHQRLSFKSHVEIVIISQSSGSALQKLSSAPSHFSPNAGWSWELGRSSSHHLGGRTPTMETLSVRVCSSKEAEVRGSTHHTPTHWCLPCEWSFFSFSFSFFFLSLKWLWDFYEPKVAKRVMGPAWVSIQANRTNHASNFRGSQGGKRVSSFPIGLTHFASSAKRLYKEKHCVGIYLRICPLVFTEDWFQNSPQVPESAVGQVSSSPVYMWCEYLLHLIVQGIVTTKVCMHSGQM